MHVDGAQVNHERVLARKGLVTAITLENLGRMRKLVRAQHPVARKRLAARVTDIGTDALVLVFVRLQVGHRLEGLLAEGAAEGLAQEARAVLVVVVAGVVVQGLLGDEALAAQVADEGLLHVLVERVQARPLLRGRREDALGDKLVIN